MLSALLSSLRRRFPGLLLTAVIAALAIRLAGVPVFADNGLSALTFAILIGLLAGNTFYPRLGGPAGPGVLFAKGELLRAGVALYGFKLTFQQVAAVGMAGVMTDLSMLLSTFLLACWFGRRFLGLERDTALLIGAGSSICGAAAVLATAPVLQPRERDVAVAVATVVVFGTLGMVVYPLLWRAMAQLALPGLTQNQFGIYIGATVHEVAQVVAAARAVGEQAADSAMVSKMIRVMMLAPFLLGLSLWLAPRSAAPDTPRRITVPVFAFVFVGCVLLNSLDLLPPSVVAALIRIDDVMLACAMAALGLTTHASAVRQAGSRPLALAAVLFVWLVAGGGAISWGWQALLA
ncbi:putative integral membrane protein (TIGR00698 family) [Microvirgula sp. AG722]|uniref:YeiH family protein n=1 Tax=Microvirgula sp. AG722 TaxID=2183901 RepID=UPI000DC2731C|nr:YeiH family protein [Microvirgula sp. AG722]RAS15589.1 putative integral membrane protein (TIGR00698 family) [Microvirgula sp. AG722]